MRLLSFLIFGAGGYAFWLTEFDRTSTNALNLVEWSAALPIPIWQILLPLGFLFFYLSRPKKEEPEKPQMKKHKIKSRERQTAQKKPAEANKKEVLHVPDRSVNEAEQQPAPKADGESAEINEKDLIRNKITSTRFMPGSKLRTDPQKGVPFGLRLNGLTPEKCKKAIAIFANFLNDIPTPPRAIVEFHGVIESGIPKQRIVQGVFRQKFTGGVIITGLQDSVEIRFNNSDEVWASHPNLDKEF